MILRNFAVFEGIDGTGTTTQLNMLRDSYDRNASGEKSPVWFTCEPTSGEIGRLIRRALSGEIALSGDAMARLFAADRAEHIYGAGGIVERLDSGMAVFSDRYLFSSLAYQGETVSTELPRKLNEDFPLPEILFFFDLDPDAAMERVERRAGKLEIYEKRDFQRKVRARYLETVDRFEREEPAMRVIRIDAALPVRSIAEKIWSIASFLPKL
jgi:dTMP kinase